LQPQLECLWLEGQGEFIRHHRVKGITGGLPVAIELDGPAGDDRRLLAIGMAVEAVLGPLPAPMLRG